MFCCLLTFLDGCATTGTSNIQQGKESELSQISSVAVEPFMSSDAVIAEAVRNTIIEMLIPSGVKIMNTKTNADVVVQGSITFSNDAVTSAGATRNYAAAVGTAGGYVSGITIRLLKGDEIIAAASETQVRTSMWIPDPAEVMARKAGNRIRKMIGR